MLKVSLCEFLIQGSMCDGSSQSTNWLAEAFENRCCGILGNAAQWKDLPPTRARED